MIIIYEAEIHYVFIETNEVSNDFFRHEEPPIEKDPMVAETRRISNICDCCQRRSSDQNYLVIGRVINNTNIYKDLSKIQVKIPTCYYEYDGTLTTGTYSPVRWIIGNDPVHFNFTSLIPIAKTSRPIQKIDGRIILFSSSSPLEKPSHKHNHSV